ncbi:CoA transferase [Desulfitobacterium sp. Sab5]|uniref:CoA transferase n=1 Tax=Desulfitobacterium nosdiversum TaxID=3375356 RepID=UPI003CF0EE29
MNRWESIERKPAPLFAPTFGPLAGIRVLLNGTVVAAPFTATMMSDFGAEVIALERPKVKGDPARHQKPQIAEGDKHISGSWIQNARNKLSFSLETNLNIPESKEIFLSLIKNSDVWIENMVWIDKLGITDQMLLEVNPKLVICHISGYGTAGFGGDQRQINRPGYDPLGQSESGWGLLQGYPDREPYYAQQYVGDYMTGLMSVNGILMSYMVAQKTGKGQIIDVSLTESWMRVMDDNFVLWTQSQYLKHRQGVMQSAYQPGGVFKCGDGGYVNLGSYGKTAYNNVLKGFGIDSNKYSYEECSSSPEAVASPLGRELDGIFKKFFAEHTAQEATDICIDSKISAAHIKTAEEVFNEPHWHKRGDWVKYTDQTLNKEVEVFGIIPKLSETPGQVWCGAPALGQDTQRVLTDLLDYSQSEIDALKGKGVID